ncbi:MAG: cytochrome P450, partial [Novosphingobium sp.]|nr:cytochrome P450 [Novosphingobium sp.]
DLVSVLLDATLREPGVEPRLMTDREIMHLVKIVMIAGGGTSWRQMGITLFALLTNPDQLAQVKADRSLVEDAVEESLRWNPTAPYFYRNATRDTELRGHKISEGDIVEVGIGPANRDPSRWDNPDVFDINRPKITNLAFGLGVHRCLGMNVAKVEMMHAINALFDAFPDMRLDPDAPMPEIGGGFEQRGPTAVPVLLR